jgi:hypothetical protein
VPRFFELTLSVFVWPAALLFKPSSRTTKFHALIPRAFTPDTPRASFGVFLDCRQREPTGVECRAPRHVSEVTD